jgi:hypothetical protein
MKILNGIVFAFSLTLCGCHVGSNVDFKAADLDKPYRGHAAKGNLNEMEVLGLRGRGEVTDEQIRKTLDEAHSLHLRRGAAILLVQSGASVPDGAMVDELSREFKVVPYTGISSEILPENGEATSLSKGLRMAAAHANADTVLVYWANLEMKRDEMPTHIVTWVPVVDVVVPDEYQKLRMRVKMALIDVRGGNWATFRAEPLEEKALSTRYAREHLDSGAVSALKKKSYRAAVRQLVKHYEE